MKTPEEIKRGLMLCGMISVRYHPCKVCAYEELCKDCENEGALYSDALAYIQQLEERIERMDEHAEQSM